MTKHPMTFLATLSLMPCPSLLCFLHVFPAGRRVILTDRPTDKPEEKMKMRAATRDGGVWRLERREKGRQKSRPNRKACARTRARTALNKETCVPKNSRRNLAFLRTLMQMPVTPPRARGSTGPALCVPAEAGRERRWLSLSRSMG